jgi:hypothetical protein
MSEPAKNLNACVADILQADDAWGILSRDIGVRLLNASGSGCLVESRSGVADGTSGSLSLHVDGTEYSDAVRITRCHAVQGAGAKFRVGVEFLWVSAPGERALRRVGRKLQQLSQPRSPRLVRGCGEDAPQTSISGD